MAGGFIDRFPIDDAFPIADSFPLPTHDTYIPSTGPATDLQSLATGSIQAGSGSGDLPNPESSLGCSPILRGILTLSGVRYTVYREIANDGDENSHLGGNAIDVDGDDTPLLLAAFLRNVPQLFACALWNSPTSEGLYIWDGALVDAADISTVFSTGARAYYAGTLHLSSSRARLERALGDPVVRDYLEAGYQDALL